MKIALGVEYDGYGLKGWQKQQDTKYTLQEFLETALAQVAGHPVATACAGRTDAGVHALGQVVHFETSVERVPAAWTLGVNTHLPPAMRVFWSKIVDDTFHARFSATARRYVFVIYNHRLRPSVYRYGMTWVFQPLDERLMHEAAQALLGEHDFSSFRSSECQSQSPCRHIDFVKVTRQGDLVFVDIQANAFLHHMVRNIVGVLIQVGMGKQPVGWVKEVLLARDRTAAAATLAPEGLYLVHVDYPPQFELPQTLHFPLGFSVVNPS